MPLYKQSTVPHQRFILQIYFHTLVSVVFGWSLDNFQKPFLTNNTGSKWQTRRKTRNKFTYCCFRWLVDMKPTNLERKIYPRQICKKLKQLQLSISDLKISQKCVIGKLRQSNFHNQNLFSNLLHSPNLSPISNKQGIIGI